MLPTHTTYQKKIFWLIGISIILKIILSHFIELGNDEVYYYTYAVQPDWNHFDHPGMVGWMMRITSLNLLWVSTLSMRLGSILCAGMATFVIFKTGTLLKNESAGYIAAWMYTISIYTGIIAGLFVLPDSPQLLFFSLSIYGMVKYVLQNSSFSTRDWLLLGLFIGLSTLSKVHGLYLWIGFGAYILFHHAKTLQKRNLYLAILVTVICVFPILYWNMQNNFITYKFHSNRVAHTGLLIDSFVQQIVGEIIYQNPLVYLSVFIALFNYKQLKKAFQTNANPNASKLLPLLLWLSFPLLLTFWGLSLFNPTLPHWTGPAYIVLFLVSGVYWSAYGEQKKGDKSLPPILQYAIGLLGVLIIGVLLFIYIAPRQIGSTQNENLGEYNPINDLTGWEAFTQSFAKIVERDKVNGAMPSNAPIVIHKWFPGGHIFFYTARPLHKAVIGVGQLQDLHKFAWLNKDYKALQIGDNAYYIVPSNLPANPQILYGNYFEKISQPDTIPIITKGVLLRNFYVYRLQNCKQLPPTILK